MPDRTDVPLPALYLVRAKGANRISHMGASRISEAFDKDAAPTVGAICIAVQAGHDYFDDLDDEDLAKGDVIIALAVVGGIGGAASGTVRATLTPIHRLSSPVPLGLLQNKPVELGDAPADYHSRKLNLGIAEALIDHLSSLDPSVTIWLAQVFGESRTFPS